MKDMVNKFCIFALAVIIGFGVTACKDTGGPGGNSGDLGEFVEPAEQIPPTTWRSLDGISFFGSHVDDRVWSIAAGQGRYVAVGGWKPNDRKAIAYSNDALRWSAASGSFYSELRCVAYGNGRFIAADVGNFRQNAPASEHSPDNYVPSNAYYSTDGGKTWSAPVNTGLRDTLSLVYGGGKWLALGLDGRMASSDNGGQSWSEIQQTIVYPSENPEWWFDNTLTTLLPKGDNSAIRDAVYVEDEETWIVVGMRGVTAWSRDLVTWNIVLVQTGLAPTVSLQKIVCANNKLFVVGDGGRMYSSTDTGKSWVPVTEHSYGNADIYNIVYANGYFVTVGSGGRVEYSEDGAVWFPAETDFGGSQAVYGLAYGGGMWLAGARSGAIAVSNVRE
jgi:hypothetical protein